MQRSALPAALHSLVLDSARTKFELDQVQGGKHGIMLPGGTNSDTCARRFEHFRRTHDYCRCGGTFSRDESRPAFHIPPCRRRSEAEA